MSAVQTTLQRGRCALPLARWWKCWNESCWRSGRRSPLRADSITNWSDRSIDSGGCQRRVSGMSNSADTRGTRPVGWDSKFEGEASL